MKASTLALCVAVAFGVAAALVAFANRRRREAGAPVTPTAATAQAFLSRAAGFSLAFAVTSWAIDR